MKNLILLIFIFSLNVISFGQNEPQRQIKTLAGNQKISHGGYGAFSIYYSKINGENALLVGGKGGWVINHRLTLGLAGYGFVNDLEVNYFDDKKGMNLSGGYGGLLIEPIIMPYELVHLTVPVLIGAGGVTYFDNNWWKDHIYPSKAFFVFEPGLELELNIIKFMRIGLGISYRITSDIGIDNMKSKNLDALSGGISFKFGRF